MKRQERHRWVPCLLAVGLALSVSHAFGHGAGEGDHQGMMGSHDSDRYGGLHGDMMDGTGPGMMGGRYGGRNGSHYGGYHGGMMDDMGPGMVGGMSGGMPGGAFFEELTAEQVQQARELLRAHRTAQFDRMEEMAELRLDLRLLLQEPRPDPEQARTLNQRLAELHGAMFEERLRLHNALQELLTAEQRARLGLPDS